MIKKLKRFFNKEDFDYSKGIVDPCEFHKIFYCWLKWFQVLDNEPIPKWTYHAQRFVAVNTMVAIALTLLGVYGNMKNLDLPRSTEAGTYAIILIYQMLNQSCTRFNVPQYHNLLRIMREDFKYACTTGQRYRKKFFESQLLTWKITFTCVVFIVFIVVGMNAFAIIFLAYFYLTHEPGDGLERPLLFPLWLFHYKITDTPLYELIFIFTSYTIAIYGYAYVFMIQNGIVWVREITAKADLIMYALEDITEGLQVTTNPEDENRNNFVVKHRMSKILQQHHSMYSLLQDFAKVYKKLLMFEQKLGGPVTCLTAYGIAERFSDGEIHGILIMLCIAAIVVVFIPSYLCTFLATKINSVCNACMDVKFWVAGPAVRPYLVLLMQRSLRPLPLQAPGFADVSLETFSRTMGSAYSMFNMLRQTNI